MLKLHKKPSQILLFLLILLVLINIIAFSPLYCSFLLFFFFLQPGEPLLIANSSSSQSTSTNANGPNYATQFYFANDESSINSDASTSSSAGATEAVVDKSCLSVAPFLSVGPSGDCEQTGTIGLTLCYIFYGFMTWCFKSRIWYP